MNKHQLFSSLRWKAGEPEVKDRRGDTPLAIQTSDNEFMVLSEANFNYGTCDCCSIGNVKVIAWAYLWVEEK